VLSGDSQGKPADHDPAIGLLLTSGLILDPESLDPIANNGDGKSIDSVISAGLVNLLASSEVGSRIERRSPDGTLRALVGLPGEPVWIGGGGASPTTTVVTLVDGQPQVFSIAADNSVTVPGSAAPTALSPQIGAADDRAFAIDLAGVFAKGNAWDLLNYSGLAITSGGSIIEETSIDLVSNTLRVTPAAYAIGQVTISLRASNGSGEVDGLITIDLPPPAAPDIELLTVPTLNRQTGLFEQQVRITNNAGRGLGAFALSLDSLPPGAEVYNRSRTSAAGAHVITFEPRLDVGGSVDLQIEYFTPGRTAPAGMTFASEAIPLALAAIAGSEGRFAIDRAIALPDGSVLIEFPSTPGESYAIEYSHDGSHWHTCPSRIRAAGNRVQWIDSGAPKTTSHPSQRSSRMYRARLLAE
jgi:hypothetical protein